MKILVLNAGSSSLKYSVFEGAELELLATGNVEKIGDSGSKIGHKYARNGNERKAEQELDIPDHKVALNTVVSLLTDTEYGVLEDISEIAMVGHRVVHGGEYFSQPTIIDQELKDRVKELIPLAPLHNPANLLGIEVSEEVIPGAKQVAVFDTAFHQTLPEHVYRYALPEKLYKEYGIRVYGMHGTSHQYVALQAAKHLNKDFSETNLITVHLGNGCSISAIKNGECIDTSLGLSPLPGLVMGTRSGDIDPSIIFHLMRTHGYTYEQVETMLNKESGLKGLTGFTDLRDIHKRQDEGDHSAQLAMDIYCYRIRKYIGAYLASVGPIDAIVLTAGVGENSVYVREHALSGLEHLGIAADTEKNKMSVEGINEIQSDVSSVKLLVIPTNEEKQIALSALALR